MIDRGYYKRNTRVSVEWLVPPENSYQLNSLKISMFAFNVYKVLIDKVRALIVRMAESNPGWGSPRIVGALQKLGIHSTKGTSSG